MRAELRPTAETVVKGHNEDELCLILGGNSSLLTAAPNLQRGRWGGPLSNGSAPVYHANK